MEGEVAIATALDAARAAGRAEGLREAAEACRDRAKRVAANDLGDTVTFVWVRDTLFKQADAIDALATATQAGDSPAAPK
jgi:hypothetical protein